MAPSSFSSGSALASLVALSSIVGDGSAYVSAPPSIARHVGKRCDASVLSSSAASDFDDTHGKTLSPLSSSSSSSSNPYIRIQKRGRHYDVQTAITTFQKKTTAADGDSKTTMVDLHAQIHFGDANYFQYFNDDAAFGSRYDKILYELIVEDKFLAPSISTTSKNSGPKNEKLMQLTLMPGGGSSTSNTNSNPIAPTEADRGTANQYGLQCQVDGIQYCKEGWVHADLTREEFMGYLYLEQGWQQQRQQKQKQKQKGHPQIMMPKAGGEQPLWALASTSATYPGSELVTSLMRPLTTSSNSASDALTRRLFTHLFLPGDALSGWIRAILWFGVPSPELSIMLVDWSSLSYIGRQSRRRGGSKRNDNNNNIAPISPIAAPVFLSLLTGNWGTARRLVFGQVLVGGQSNSDTSKGGVLIRKRNERAMEVLQDSLSSLSDKEADDDDDTIRNTSDRKNRVALL